jgi:hypothetical protein
MKVSKLDRIPFWFLKYLTFFLELHSTTQTLTSHTHSSLWTHVRKPYSYKRLWRTEPADHEIHGVTVDASQQRESSSPFGPCAASRPNKEYLDAKHTIHPQHISSNLITTCLLRLTRDPCILCYLVMFCSISSIFSLLIILFHTRLGC